MRRSEKHRLEKEQRRELVDRAMTALKPRGPLAQRWIQATQSRARRWTIGLAARFRQMTRRTGAYNRAAKFSGLRAELKAQGEAARKLARRMINLTTRLQIALHYLLQSQQAVDDAIGERYELAWKLQQHADAAEQLSKLSRRPKGGNLNLAKIHFGPPKQWLVQESVKVFFHHGDPDEIKAISPRSGSRFGDYVGAVFELATGINPWDEGVGLDKAINGVARAYRKRERQKVLP